MMWGQFRGASGRGPSAMSLMRASHRGATASQVLRALLFGQGQQGVMYVPQPTVDGQQVLFQDSLGTTPVTADGDPVGYMADLSGNGNHATQATSAARPIYRTDGVLHWLEFDGVEDSLALPSTLGLDNEMMVLAGFELGSASQLNGRIWIYDADNIDNENFMWSDRSSNSEGLMFRRTSSTTYNGLNFTGSAGDARATRLICNWWWDGASDFLRVNGNSVTTRNTAGQATTGGNNIASRGDGSHAILDFYGGIIVSSAGTDANRLAAEQYIASLSGVTI